MKPQNSITLKISADEIIDFETFLNLLEKYLIDELLFEKIVERMLIKNKCDKTLTGKLLNLTKCEELRYLLCSIRKYNL